MNFFSRGWLVLPLFVLTFSFSYAGNSTYVVSGQSTTVSWSVTGASSCYGSFPGTTYPANNSEQISGSTYPNGIYGWWLNNSHTGSGSAIFNNILAIGSNGGTGYAFRCTDNVTGANFDAATLNVYSLPTASASCSYNSSTGKYSITVNWSAVDGTYAANNSGYNYPQRLKDPSGAETDIGGGVQGDAAPTGTSYTYNNLTQSGTYTYWGNVWSPQHGWSTAFPNNGSGSTVTCSTTPPPPSSCPTQTATWGSCSGTLSGVASGQSSTASNNTSGFSGSATYSCSNGSWTQTSQSCTQNQTTGGTGVCGTTAYQCQSGTASNQSFNGSAWNWTCDGTQCTQAYGSQASCGYPHYQCSIGTVSNQYAAPDGSEWDWNCNVPGNTASCFEGNYVFVNTQQPVLVSQLSSTTTIQYTASATDGNPVECKLNSYNNQTPTPSSYNYTTASTTITAGGDIMPGWWGDYPQYFWIKCRNTVYPAVVGWGNWELQVCPTGQVWNNVDRACETGPDLTAGAVQPSTATPNQNTAVYALMMNVGGTDVTSPFYYFYQEASGSQGSGTITDLSATRFTDGLASGETYQTVRSMTFMNPGIVSFRLCVDKKNSSDTGLITESNENNNCGPWSDLCVSSTGTCGPPQAVNQTVVNNFTPNGTLQFQCLNSSEYRITRTEGATGIYPTASTTYSGTVNSPVSVAGNYNLICSNGTSYDSKTVSYSPTATPPSGLILNGAPRTIDSGGKMTLSWSINNPNSSCKITAKPVCTGTCSQAQTDAAASLTSILATGTTDANDPNGGSRSMSSALQTAVSGTKALGRKTLQVGYTTDFQLTCGASSATSSVRILVSTNNEG